MSTASVVIGVDRLRAVADGRSAVLAGQIREVRERNHLSQREIARALGVSPATVSRWEGKHRLPRDLSARRIAGLLEALDGTDFDHAP